VPRSLHQQSDSRGSHDVCVGGLLGMELPRGMFWGSKPMFLHNNIVKSHELQARKYLRVIGLSALVCNVIFAYPWSADHGIV